MLSYDDDDSSDSNNDSNAPPADGLVFSLSATLIFWGAVRTTKTCYKWRNNRLTKLKLNLVNNNASILSPESEVKTWCYAANSGIIDYYIDELYRWTFTIITSSTNFIYGGMFHSSFFRILASPNETTKEQLSKSVHVCQTYHRTILVLFATNGAQ